MFSGKFSRGNKASRQQRRQQQQQQQQQQNLQLIARDQSQGLCAANATIASKQDYFVDCTRNYSCVHCRAHLANHDELISKLFQGNNGRAYLFNKVVNISCKPAVQRELLTGLHAVADIYCDICGTTLGWKYEQAFVPSQKYKEGKYIIELVHMIKENSWDPSSYNHKDFLQETRRAPKDRYSLGLGFRSQAFIRNASVEQAGNKNAPAAQFGLARMNCDDNDHNVNDTQMIDSTSSPSDNLTMTIDGEDSAIIGRIRSCDLQISNIENRILNANRELTIERSAANNGLDDKNVMNIMTLAIANEIMAAVADDSAETTSDSADQDNKSPSQNSNHNSMLNIEDRFSEHSCGSSTSREDDPINPSDGDEIGQIIEVGDRAAISPFERTSLSEHSAPHIRRSINKTTTIVINHMKPQKSMNLNLAIE